MRVARVVVDVPLAHLDRTFDYAVPDELAGDVAPGVRVRVRFAGQLVDGFVLALADDTEHTGTLAPLAKVVSSEPVLTPEVAALARSVADRWGGTLPDVLRLAIPPRRAAAEKRPPAERPPAPAGPDPAGFARYPTGPALLTAVAEGRPAHAVWTALPGEDWPARLAELCQAALSGGRGALVVVPDGRDLDRLEAAAAARLPKGSFVVLRADAAPDSRYRRFLDAVRGSAQVVLGTRAAMFAPVADLGLVAIWDDGDDLHAEPRAPYPHARDVLVHRAHLAGCAAVIAATARTAEAALLVESGWAHQLVADRATLRAAAPRVQALGDDGRAVVQPGPLDQHVAGVRIGRVVVGVQVVAVVPHDHEAEVAHRREHRRPGAQHDLGRAAGRRQEGPVALLRGVAGPEDGERVLRQHGRRTAFQAVEVLAVGDDDERPAAGRQRGSAQLRHPGRPVLPREGGPDGARRPSLGEGGQQRRARGVPGEAGRIGRSREGVRCR